MNSQPGKIAYALVDNGKWKQASITTEHYGLENIGKRCLKNSFEFTLSTQEFSSRNKIAVPTGNVVGNKL